MNWVLVQLSGIGELIKSVFAFIFPEYTFAGILVTGLAGLLLVFYTFKSGLREGIKVSVSIWLVLVVVLFSIHQLAKIFTPH